MLPKRKKTWTDISLIEHAEINDLEGCKHLIDKGVNVNSRNKYGVTALIQASRRNLVEIVKMLLLCLNINVNGGDNDNWTPLMYASINNHYVIVKLLLACHGIRHTKNKFNCTALMYASYKGYLKIVKLLLTRFWGDINVKSKSGRTALEMAVHQSRVEILKLLLAHGAEVGDINDNLNQKPDIRLILQNWKSYLPPFKRYATTNKYYPRKFKQWVFNFILCCL